MILVLRIGVTKILRLKATPEYGVGTERLKARPDTRPCLLRSKPGRAWNILRSEPWFGVLFSLLIKGIAPRVIG
jgi:hypothetical protein